MEIREKVSPRIEEKLLSQVFDALSILAPLEATILRLAFGLVDGIVVSREEIAKRLGLTVTQVKDTEILALRRLKHPSRSQIVKPFPIEGKISTIPPIIKPETPIEPKFEPVTGPIELPSGSTLLLITQDISGSLVRYFAEHPEEMKTMDRRKFEELIAGLFDVFGYQVELTKRTRDGGVDIIAVKDAEVKVKYLIQAKRPEPYNPIGVRWVREIMGVKEIKGATKAILATTTYFSKPAIMESEIVKWELDLRDYEGILDWLEQYKKMKAD
jgi:DNA-binding CsgD family transcriptional regulator